MKESSHGERRDLESFGDRLRELKELMVRNILFVTEKNSNAEFGFLWVGLERLRGTPEEC